MKEIFECIWAVFDLIGTLVRLLAMLLLIIVTLGPYLFIIKIAAKTKDDIEKMVTKYIVKIFNIGGIPIKESDLLKKER